MLSSLPNYFKNDHWRADRLNDGVQRDELMITSCDDTWNDCTIQIYGENAAFMCEDKTYAVVKL